MLGRFKAAAAAAILATTVLGAVETVPAYDMLPQVAELPEMSPTVQRVVETSRLFVSERCEANEEVLEVHDRLVRAMALEGAFQEEQTQFSSVVDAVQFAADKHYAQRRKCVERTPYIIHPMGVALILWSEGSVRDPDVLSAALLHDTVEDTKTSHEEIAETFGGRVAGIVAEVTDDKSLPKAVRKHLQIVNAPHKSEEAKLVRLADKLYNLRDLQRSAPVDWERQHSTPWAQVRIDKYFAWAEQVVEGMRGTNAALEEQLDIVFAAHRAEREAR